MGLAKLSTQIDRRGIDEIWGQNARRALAVRRLVRRQREGGLNLYGALHRRSGGFCRRLVSACTVFITKAFQESWQLEDVPKAMRFQAAAYGPLGKYNQA
jgi:hypothetical protein